MSTLKATNIKNESSASNNIVLDSGGGVVVSGILTATTFSGDGSSLTGVASTENVSTNSLVVVGVTTVSAGSAAAPSITPSGDPNTGVFFPSADTIAFGEGGAEAARIDSSRRLLLGRTTSAGTATPAVLQVGGGDGVTTFNKIAIISGSGEDAGGLVLSSTAQNALEFQIDPDNLRANSNLNFTIDAKSRFTMGSDGVSQSFADAYGHTFRTGSSASGSIEIIYCTRNASNVTNGTGVYAVYSNGSYSTLSDQTQKKNIEPTRDGYLDDLNRLRVVKYNWNEQEDIDPKELGLIAQEVEQVFPGLISEMRSKDEETGEEISKKGIKYSVLPVMLLKALQEATTRIEQLEAQNTAILARLDALESA